MDRPTNILFSENYIAQLAINFVINRMHGGCESFDSWYKKTRNVTKCHENDIFDYDYLKLVSESFCEYSEKRDWDAIYDMWYNNYQRYIKILKIKNTIKHGLKT